MPGDHPDQLPFGEKFVHHRMVPACPLGELPSRLRLWLADGRWLCRRPGIRSGCRPGLWLAQAGAVRGGAPFDRLGEVLPKMEPVSDLDRVRRPGAGAV
jgi:hypothetical protein